MLIRTRTEVSITKELTVEEVCEIIRTHLGVDDGVDVKFSVDSYGDLLGCSVIENSIVIKEE